jgi:transcriptional regulator with XRE-family HTH domain
MSVISKKFADELSNDKPMRDAYLEEKTRAKLAVQIKANRVARGLSQVDLGNRMGKTQSNIHRLEDQNIARYTLTTLFQFATEYDCGLIVEFVPYNEFLQKTADLNPSHLQVPSFTPASLTSLWNGDNILVDANLLAGIGVQTPSKQMENPAVALIQQSWSLLTKWTQSVEYTTYAAMGDFGRNVELTAQDALLSITRPRSPVFSISNEALFRQQQIDINGITA